MHPNDTEDFKVAITTIQDCLTAQKSLKDLTAVELFTVKMNSDGYDHDDITTAIRSEIVRRLEARVV